MVSIKSIFSIVVSYASFFFLKPFFDNFIVYKKLAESKNVKINQFKFALASAILPISTVTIFLLTLIYYKIIYAILYLKLGNKFGGFINGRNAFYSLNHPQQMVMVTILFIESDKDPENFYKTTKETLVAAIEQRFKSNVKLLGISEYFMGYLYVIKDALRSEDCIRELAVSGDFPRAMTKEELLLISEKHCKEDFPADNKGFWEVLIGKQKVLWKEATTNQEIQVYPILFKVSHTLTDMLHLYRAILMLFDSDVRGDSSSTFTNIYRSHIKKFSFSDTFNFFFVKVLYVIQQSLYFFKCVPVFLVNFDLLQSSTMNSADDEYENNAIMCLTKNDSSKYLYVAQNIRKRFPGVKVTDIFATALNLSLCDYFRKYTTVIPKNLTCTLPVAININVPEDNRKGDIFNNKVQLLMLSFPISSSAETSNISLVSVLKAVSLQRSIMDSSHEGEISYWTVNVLMRYLPLRIAKWMAFANASTALLSNIPALPLIKLKNGCKLKGTVAFARNICRTKIGFAFTGYNDIPQLSFSVNRNFIKEQEKAQEVLEGICKYMDALDDAIR